MHTRRDALKMMTVGLGALALPTIGFSDQQIQNQTPRKVMGVDQIGSELTCLLQLNQSDEWPRRLQCSFEHLPAIMQEYAIEHCVIDSQPLMLQATKFAEIFPGRVTLCYWSSGALLKRKDTSGDGYTTKACGNLVLYHGGACIHAFAKRRWFFNRHLPKQEQELDALHEMAGFIHFLKETNQLSMC